MCPSYLCASVAAFLDLHTLVEARQPLTSPLRDHRPSPNLPRSIAQLSSLKGKTQASCHGSALALHQTEESPKAVRFSNPEHVGPSGSTEGEDPQDGVPIGSGLRLRAGEPGSNSEAAGAHGRVGKPPQTDLSCPCSLASECWPMCALMLAAVAWARGVGRSKEWSIESGLFG